MVSGPEFETENALLLKVLRGMRQSPISREDFQEYLDSERSGELSKFFGAAEKHENVAKEKVPDAVGLAVEITDHYIKMNAEEEINISDADRKRILIKLEQDQVEAGLDPTLFKEAKGEVIKMLSGDKFQRFLKRQLETNISDTEARRRGIAAAVMLLISGAIVGVLMWVQTFAQAPFDSRGWRLLCLPFLFWGCALIFSSQAKVCQGLAGKCVRMKEGDSWFTAFSKGKGIQQIQDDLAMKRLLAKARRLTRDTFIATFILMAIILVVPPGYGVGAPN